MGAEVLVRNSAKVQRVSSGNTAATYAQGKVVGTAKLISGAAQSSKSPIILESLAITDADKQAMPIDIMFFSDKPASSFTDGGTFASQMTAADLPLVLGRVSVAAADYSNSKWEATKLAIGLLLQPSKNKDLYMLVVAQGAGTFTGTDNLQVNLGLLQD